MKAPTVHALQHDQVAPSIDDRTGNGDAGLVGHVNGRRHHPLGALMRQALAVSDIHRQKSAKKSIKIVRQDAASSKTSG